MVLAALFFSCQVFGSVPDSETLMRDISAQEKQQPYPLSARLYDKLYNGYDCDGYQSWDVQVDYNSPYKKPLVAVFPALRLSEYIQNRDEIIGYILDYIDAQKPFTVTIRKVQVLPANEFGTAVYIRVEWTW